MSTAGGLSADGEYSRVPICDVAVWLSARFAHRKRAWGAHPMGFAGILRMKKVSCGSIHSQAPQRSRVVSITEGHVLVLDEPRKDHCGTTGFRIRPLPGSTHGAARGFGKIHLAAEQSGVTDEPPSYCSCQSGRVLGSSGSGPGGRPFWRSVRALRLRAGAKVVLQLRGRSQDVAFLHQSQHHKRR